jgi:hypothetical protein
MYDDYVEKQPAYVPISKPCDISCKLFIFQIKNMEPYFVASVIGAGRWGVFCYLMNTYSRRAVFSYTFISAFMKKLRNVRSVCVGVSLSYVLLKSAGIV